MNHDIHFAPRRRGLGNSPSLAPHRILERNWHPVAAANDDADLLDKDADDMAFVATALGSLTLLLGIVVYFA